MVESILVVGIKNLADILGITPSAVKYHIAHTPSFPVAKLKPGNKWASTKPQLETWAQDLISSAPPDGERASL